MPLSENEEYFLMRWSRFGSAMYPIRKLNKGWIWEESHDGIKGTPLVYKTKKAALAAIEAYIDILLARKAGRL